MTNIAKDPARELAYLQDRFEEAREMGEAPVQIQEKDYDYFVKACKGRVAQYGRKNNILNALAKLNKLPEVVLFYLYPESKNGISFPAFAQTKDGRFWYFGRIIKH